MFDEAMKYVMYDHPNLGGEIPLIFPPIMDHNKVMHRMAAVSAGFCNIYSVINPDYPDEGRVRVQCFGRSETLKLDCRPEDSEIIQKFLNKHLD